MGCEPDWHCLLLIGIVYVCEVAQVVHPWCVSVQLCHGSIEEVVPCLFSTPLPQAQVVPGLPPPAGLAELPPSTLLLTRSKVLPAMSAPPPSTTSPPERRL